jgi:hypothetical protein
MFVIMLSSLSRFAVVARFASDDDQPDEAMSWFSALATLSFENALVLDQTGHLPVPRRSLSRPLRPSPESPDQVRRCRRRAIIAR